MTQSTRGLRRAAAGVLSGLVATAGLASLAPTAGAVSSFRFTRLAGGDRFDTAKIIATDGFGTSSRVLIARGDTFPDALAGNYMAGQFGVPILLVRTDSIPTPTTEAIQALGATQATILGGTSAVSSGVESQLRSRGMTVDRVSGATRFDTASNVAKAFGGNAVGTVDGTKTAIVASGRNFPDALTGGPLAYAGKLPVLLTEPGSLPSQTSAALSDLGIKSVWLLGGTVAVSSSVEDAIRSRGITVTRVAGGTRQSTATAAADVAVSKLGFSVTHINLARGDDFADALTMGPHGGKEKAPILLTGSPTVLSNETRDDLTANAGDLQTGHIAGGPAAVSTAVENEANTAAQSGGNAGAATLTINNSTVPPGGAVSGKLTGANIKSVTVNGCGLNNAPVNRDANGAFTINLPTSQAAGSSCELVFTTTFNDNTTETDRATIAVSQNAGPITLDRTSANQGATINGTVADPGQVKSITVTGCGFNNQAVPLNSNGGFSLTIPAQQAPGTCALDFSVTRLNGAVDRQSIPFSVNSASRVSTAAPDLVSARRLDGNALDIIYTFDQNITATGAPAASAFHAYTSSGTRFEPTAVQVQANGTEVIARFANTSIVPNVTTATVDQSAVLDAQGRGNPIGQAGVQSLTNTQGRTASADLVSVVFSRFDAGRAVFDFAFDEPVVAGTIDTTKFDVVAEDGTVFTAPANAVVGISADAKTVSVAFTATPPSQVPTALIRRGVVRDAGVQRVGNNLANVLQTEPVGTPAQPTGQTDQPDLRATTAISSTSTGDVVRFTFDQPVGSPNGALFGLYNNNAQAFTGGTTSVVGGDATSVDVTFAPGTVGASVGTFARTGAVVGTTTGSGQNINAELPLQSLSFPAGRTARPDLASVIRQTDSFGNNSVVFTFDQPTGGAPLAADLFLYDATGSRFLASGVQPTPVDSAGTSWRVTFSNSQVAAAVLGAVKDSTCPTAGCGGGSGGGALVRYPEGNVGIT